MLKGKTKRGFEYEIPKENFDSMETLDALAEVDRGNVAALPRAAELLLGKELKNRLYEDLRTEKGNVPIEPFMKELFEIMNAAGEEGKN